MRVKYIKSSDLGIVESTVNLLLSEGWEREGQIRSTPDGEWIETLINYDRPLRGQARAIDLPRGTSAIGRVVEPAYSSPAPRNPADYGRPVAFEYEETLREISRDETSREF